MILLEIYRFKDLNLGDVLKNNFKSVFYLSFVIVLVVVWLQFAILFFLLEKIDGDDVE